MMDCLPADSEGKPLSASRDLALHEWAGRIPETGFPLVLAGSFLWFPSHTVAFRTFFCISGAIGFVTSAIFIFLVHPRDEVSHNNTKQGLLHMQHATCNMQHATCNMQRTADDVFLSSFG